MVFGYHCVSPPMTNSFQNYALSYSPLSLVIKYWSNSEGFATRVSGSNFPNTLLTMQMMMLEIIIVTILNVLYGLNANRV